MKRKRFGKEIRKAVHNKYNRHCAYCGTEIPIFNMQIDHLIRRQRYRPQRH